MDSEKFLSSVGWLLPFPYALPGEVGCIFFFYFFPSSLFSISTLSSSLSLLVSCSYPLFLRCSFSPCNNTILILVTKYSKMLLRMFWSQFSMDIVVLVSTSLCFLISYTLMSFDWVGHFSQVFIL